MLEGRLDWAEGLAAVAQTRKASPALGALQQGPLTERPAAVAGPLEPSRSS